MVRTSEVGSQTIVSFQTKFPVFTILDLDTVMTELGFAKNVSQATAGQPQQTIYSKGNVYVDYQNNTINFRFLNIVNISNNYEDVKQTLLKLNINNDSIHLMGLNCKTMVHEVGDPESILTKLISPDAKERIKNSLDMEPGVTSLVLANNNPQDEDIQIRIEPLASNPKDSFFININYKTSVHKKFNEFISNFGESKLMAIVKGVCGE